MPDDELIPIGAFARAARLTVKALRHYHALGILSPAWVDPSSGYRYYRWDQLGDALSVTMLRDLDVPLERIGRHVAGGAPLHEVLVEERRRLERQVARARRALAVIDALAASPELPRGEVAVVDRDAERSVVVAAEVHADTLGVAAGGLVASLLAAAGEAGLDTAAAVVGEYPIVLAGTVTATVHLPVGASHVPDGFVAGHLPAGRFASTVHTGPHESLPLAYHTLLRWFAATGWAAAGPVYERYLDDPATTDPSQLRTEVLHPLPDGAVART
jgi:DNA-binding transcriptional MerR regulator